LLYKGKRFLLTTASQHCLWTQFIQHALWKLPEPCLPSPYPKNKPLQIFSSKNLRKHKTLTKARPRSSRNGKPQKARPNLTSGNVKPDKNKSHSKLKTDLDIHHRFKTFPHFHLRKP
jgi:hypothetical protein